MEFFCEVLTDEDGQDLGFQVAAQQATITYEMTCSIWSEKNKRVSAHRIDLITFSE